MANMTMTKMVFPTAVSVPGTYGNLMTPDPKEIASSGGALDMDLDFGANVTADTFFAGFITGTPSGINLSTATGYGTGIANTNAMILGPTTAKRRHAFLKLGSSLTSRYWRVTVLGSGFTMGIFGLGQSVQPTWGHEWGSGRQPIDTASVSPLRGGGFAIESGAVKGAWQYSLGDLTDADLKALWAMTQDIGIHSPVLAMEDPALTGQDMNDALHYGLLDRPEVYERQFPGSSRWNFRVEEWV